MRFFDWVAAVVLWFELPIPLYWLLLHSRVEFWRRHVKAAYLFSALPAWGAAAGLLLAFHERLFASARTPWWASVAGLALIATEAYILFRVEHELGSRRLVGHAELQREGELATEGLYARVRHPRYAGMMCAVAGACLLAATPLLWLIAAAWWLLALIAIRLEEQELAARFGPAYAAYCRRVPRFLPLRLHSE